MRDDGGLREQESVDEREDEAADDHARDVAHAAEHEHRKHEYADVELKLVRRYETELRRIRHAREPAERSAEREGREFCRRRVDAHVACGEFVFANRHPRAPESAVLQIARREDREHDEHEQHVIVRRRAEPEVMPEDRGLIE